MTHLPFGNLKRTVALFLALGSTVASVAAARDTKLLKAEQLLSQLGYWIIKVDGVADSSTRHAIIAFQKVEGLKRTGNVSSGLLESLEFAARPPARFNTGRRHLEIDIRRQVLFIVGANGIVEYILPVSTGNEKPYVENGKRQIAHTPRGTFTIYRQIKGVRHAPLGDLFYPNYFYGGVAVHGSNSVPPYPASHGCVRIPRFAERPLSGMVSIGTEVFVFD